MANVKLQSGLVIAVMFAAMGTAHAQIRPAYSFPAAAATAPSGLHVPNTGFYVTPYVGFDWNLRPLTVSAGWVSYIFPERESLNTSEVYGKLALDDSLFFHTDRGLLNPYVYAAYDYDRYDGLYLEAGFRHDFPIEDTGVIVTAVADVGYVMNHRFFSLRNGDDTGFQHYDVGLQYVGHAAAWDRIELRGNLRAHDFAAFYVRGGRVLAVVTAGRDLAALEAEAAMEAGDEEKLDALMRAA